MKQQMSGWNSLKYDYNKDNMDSYVQKLILLASILDMNDQQLIAKFKDSFDSNISAHLIDSDDFDVLQKKAEQLVQMYKPTSTSTVALSHAAFSPVELRAGSIAECSQNEHTLKESIQESEPSKATKTDQNKQQENPNKRQKTTNSNNATRGKGQGNFR
ncbi:MAG: hypothetical protein MJA29_07665, partial [Candidatus Omnitrophica bacterium]|nr:hypothetical protein [Candidatus Omnitrophota bacterium]